MKHTKKLLAAVMALTMVSAIAPMSAFADTEIKRDSSNHSGDMTATYDVKAKYCVTIPAGVTLDSENSVTANFTASDVILESGQKIKVTLNSANHTESGATFHAQTENGDSTATYTISKGETAVAVGDVVAEFTENGEQSLTFSKAEGATYAGTHTETLTFGIAVENAVVTPKTYPSLKTGDILHVGDIVTSADSNSGYSFKNYWCSFPKNKSFKLVRADISIRGSASVTESDTGAYYVFLNLSYNEGDTNRNFGLEEVEEQEELDDLTGKVIFKATETSDGLEVTVDDKQKISFSVHES